MTIQVDPPVFAPFVPLEAGEALVHRWTFYGDTREVNLIRTAQNSLICRVFDRATNQYTSRIINKGNFSLEERITNITEQLQPELVNMPMGPTCLAVFVSKESQTVQGWHTGSYENINIRLVVTQGERIK